MTTKTGLFAAAWALSCGSAFLIGRTSSESPAETKTAASSQNAPASSSRSVSNRGSDSANSSSGRRASTGRTSTTTGTRDLEALKSRVVDLKNMTDAVARAEGFLELVRNLEPDEFLAAVDAFREGGIGNEQFGEYRLLLTTWAEVAPLEALDYAKENTGTNYARQTILAAWAKTDTEGAVAWAKENFDNEGDEKRANPWIVGVIEGISSQDLGRATQLLEELPFSRGRGEALGAVFDEVLADGIGDAKLWVRQLTDQSLKEGAAERLASQIAKEDPQAAADWAASMSDDILKRSAGSIIDRWADIDIDAAKSWVNNQPVDVIAASGPQLIENILEKEDVASAEVWLSNYEGDPAFDDSVRTFVRRSIDQEPNTAANWIMKLSNTRDQEMTFHRVLRGWMSKDRDGAINYINANPVPDSIKRRAGMTQEQR